MWSVTTDPWGARAFALARPTDAPLAVVGASLGAARAFVREVTEERGATLGLCAHTLDSLAQELAAPSCEARGLTFVSAIGLEALLSEQICGLDARALGRFAPSVGSPGLVRAIARAIAELAEADVAPSALAAHDAVLAELYGTFRTELAKRGLVDRAGRLTRAIARLAAGAELPPVLLLAPPVRTALEAQFVRAIGNAAPGSLAVAPRWQAHLWQALGDDVELVPSETTPLARAAEQLFAPEVVANPGVIERYAARTEAEECAELASRVVRAVDAGTKLSSIAIVLTAPESYRGPVESALFRAGVPVASLEGARRPDPRGRALLALIDCALEGLSARAFAEYLSFGELPPADDGAPPPAWPPSERAVDDDDVAEDDPEEALEGSVRSGTLRSPRRFERVLVDAAVVGGGPSRWHARIGGLRERLERASAAAEDQATLGQLVRERADLEAFAAFAFPLIEALFDLVGRELGGGSARPVAEHVERLSAIATRALRKPHRVLRVLSDLRLRGDVARLTLAELRSVLLQPLLYVSIPRSPGAHGVELLSIAEVAGRSFDEVFLVGLSERLFPRPVRDDPVLGDAVRERLNGEATEPLLPPRLPCRRDRVTESRDLLRAAVLAARRKVTASHARTDAVHGRTRLPSLYLLELARVADGRLPPTALVAPDAARSLSGAPRTAAHAIDLVEHGLSMLDAAFASPVAAGRGAARYLFAVHPTFERAVRQRFMREQHDREYSTDGLAVADPAGKALLAKHATTERAYSATGLESFAACPYRFYLKAILRLSKVERQEPLLSIDPLLFGSLFHSLQFRALTRARAEAIPFEPASMPRLAAVLDDEMRALRRALAEEHVLAVPGSVENDLSTLHEDARRWLADLCASGWSPLAAELAFGLTGPAAEAERDAKSRAEALALPSGFRLRGAIDLVEQKGEELRATDHKTGRPRVKEGARIAGGTSLQPALYAEALVALCDAGVLPPRTVVGGRLSYCTTKGGFSSVDVPYDDEVRRGLSVLREAIDGELARGRLLRRPDPDGCRYCDYAVVCGPDEQERSAQKRVPEALATLRRRR